MVAPLAYYDLIEACTKPGCAICTLLLKDAQRLLDSLLYERVNEPDSHRSFRAARGLCNEHAWQLTEYRGGALGVAILYGAAVDELLHILELDTADKRVRSFSRQRDHATALAEKLKPTANCMVCKLLSDAERDYAGVFSRFCDTSELQKAYEASEGFCLPHFRLILKQSYSSDTLKRIIDTQRHIWKSLRADLAEFVDKNRHERLHEDMGHERDSWQRAIRQMAGAKGVFGLEERPVNKNLR